MGVVVLVAVAVTIWWLLTSRPDAVPVTANRASVVGPLPSSALGPSAVLGQSSVLVPSASVTGSPAGSAAAGPSARALLVIDVAGRVRRPGIYRLPTGSRVYDAIRAAGGARRGVDLISLNLAAPVQDGQQIVVGRAARANAPDPPAGAVPTSSASSAAPVDLNTATLEQLDTLPGVGPVLAQHILDWRAQHGSFASVSQLNDVSGIGEVKYAELRERVTV
jgi:competence protein ComEA